MRGNVTAGEVADPDSFWRAPQALDKHVVGPATFERKLPQEQILGSDRLARI